MLRLALTTFEQVVAIVGLFALGVFLLWRIGDPTRADLSRFLAGACSIILGVALLLAALNT